MTALQTIRPDALTIGGAQFYGGDRTLYAVRAETGEALSQQPIPRQAEKKRGVTIRSNFC